VRKNRKPPVNQTVMKEEKELILEDKQENNNLLYSNIRKKLKINFKNEHQKELWELLDKKEITFCSGVAGTGKSYLSVYKSLQLLMDDSNLFNNIIIIRPTVITLNSINLGALPGTLTEKIDVFLYSTYYIFEKIIGKRRVEKLKEKNILRYIALQYARGLTIDNSIIIIEESQNMTIEEMKLILSRIGANSKYIISGDLSQSDLRNKQDSGLTFALKNFKNMDEIGIFQFNEQDIVRNKIISKLLKKFEENGF